MFRYIVLLELMCLALAVECQNLGPRYPPTKGEIWPKPRTQTKEDTYFVFDNEPQFVFNVTHYNCDIISNATKRSSASLHRLLQLASRSPVKPHPHARADRSQMMYASKIKSLDVELTQPCEEYPHAGMDEGYTLEIREEEVPKLSSTSVWGIVRGLESFTQLFYLTDDYNEIRIDVTSIVDYPRYEHRGLLLDTSRHYLSVDNIMVTLDAMAINKMNVFHWHIVDDQSFPYQSKRYPKLSALGAYHGSAVYSREDIARVIEHARLRGIRVLPEFDVPGHTLSWGAAYPEVLTKCYSGDKEPSLGPMNPLNNATYQLVGELFEEVQELFPERYFHIGGDEVQLDCWASNPEILVYMAKHNLTSVKQLHALFMRRVIPLLARDSQPVVWQEVFDEGVPLSNETLVQVWKSDWISEMKLVLMAGHRVIFSSAWYLDHLSSGGDWEQMYEADPRSFVGEPTNQNVVGGEACMWGEVVDDTNVISRVWPRTSAVAERLWSPLDKAPGVASSDVRNRLEEHTCRMLRRGVRAQPPNGPAYCLH